MIIEMRCKLVHVLRYISNPVGTKVRSETLPIASGFTELSRREASSG